MGAATIIVFTVAALLAPLFTADPLHQDYDALMRPPSLEYPIGTDSLGRDNLSRLIHGGRVSLQVGLFATVIATTIGVTIGLVAGYFGKWIDSILMRIVDLILAFPALLLAILMVAILGPSLRNAMLAIAVAFIPSFARVTRANTLSLREKEFVESARAIGGGPVRILFKTILPNTVSPIIVQASLVMSYAILIGGQPQLPRTRHPASHSLLGLHARRGPGVHYYRLVVDDVFPGLPSSSSCSPGTSSATASARPSTPGSAAGSGRLKVMVRPPLTA